MKGERFNVPIRRSRSRGYPFATILCYGPDKKRATKAVVSIFKKAEEGPAVMKKWVSREVRRDKKVQMEIATFLKENLVKSFLITDEPIGCIHEEGKDYPIGEDCPFCPFWKGKQ